MATRKTAWHGPVKDKLNVDELATMFKLPTWDKIDEMNIDTIWENGDAAYKEALQDGESEKKAEESREKAEHAAGNEVYRTWHDAVMSAAENLFGKHHLELIAVPMKRKSVRPYEYRVQPKTSWDAALKQIIETINGVGMFHFSSAREFLDSGPYASARIGVLTHLHHIKDYPRVYGGTSAQHLYERAFR